MFGERKKSHDKIYPKGYVEMLEQQQLQLVVGLQNLYKRIIDDQGWLGQPLDITPTGHPLIHDILERLDAIHIQGANSPDHFEEDFDMMQQRLLADGAVPIKRQPSEESESSQDTATIPDAVSPTKTNFNNPLHQFVGQVPLSLAAAGNIPAAFYNSSPQTYLPPWMGPSITYEQSQYNPPISPPVDYDDPSHVHAHANPCLPLMSPWVDEEGRSNGFPGVDLARRFGLPQDQR
ncbi:MAG: hypothetical protein LQ352_000500 [Teloschistes flavicans]|nr:MAG: hypothetical protein LQ352_000500 [Teloschistes flavicans]